MSKKILPLSAFTLAALASGVFAQAELDVIYRDFPVTAEGFEEFAKCDENYSISTAIGISGDKYTTGSGEELKYGNCNSGANIGKRGYHNGPDRLDCNGWEWGNVIRVTTGMVGSTLSYDKGNCPEEDIMEDPDNPDNPRDFVKYRYCARPTQGNGNCNSSGKIEQWFSKGGDAREVRDIIELARQSDGKYLINYDYNTNTKWNNDGYDNGFFPLDKYDDGSNQTWGRQSLNYWCPDSNGDVCGAWRANGGPKNPTSGISAANSKGVKNKLHNYGFSAAGSGAFKYNENANDVFKFIGDDDMWIFIDGELVADLGGVHLAAPANINIREYGHNKGWTNNTTHVVNFFYMDRQTDGSNFRLEMSLSNLAASRFGAPRILKAETEQSNDKSETVIYVSNILDEQSIRQFLTNGEFPIVINKPGSNTLYGFKLESISGPIRVGSSYAYTITGQVCKDKSCTKAESGPKLIIGSGDSLSFNVKYDDLKEHNPNYVIFDGLALPNSDVNGDLYIRASGNGTKATKVSYGVNTTTMPPIVFKPEVTDNDVRKPDFNMDIWFTGNPDGGKGNGGGSFPGGGGSLPSFDVSINGGKTNTNGLFPSITQIWDKTANGGAGGLVSLPGGTGNSTVHGFGTKGTPIPPNRAGELILTAYPNAGSASYSAWEKDSAAQKLFGMPPTSYDGMPFGVANPTEEQPNGGYMFVKNGFPDESSVGGVQVAPTRCISDNDQLVNGNAPRVNCLNFSLKAKQPFQLAVTVYDQLGNFVTQYRETVSEPEFRSVVQGPTFIEGQPNEGDDGYVYPSSECRYPNGPEDFGKEDIITTNGLVKVNVNIYPFSKDGRRFGNGIYILKIDRVDLSYNGCMNSEGTPVFITEKFIRYHADTKFGWMRTK